MTTIKTKAFFLLLVTGLLVSCQDDDFRPCIRGNNDSSTETRSLSDFESVDILIEGDVEIRKSERYEIVVEGNSNQIEELKTRVSNGKLKIYSDRCFKNTDFRFIVYTPELSEVKLSGSGDAWVRDEFSSDEMEFNVSGSGKIRAAVESAVKVKTRISGSGTLSLEGVCDTFQAELSGSGKIQAFGLVSNTANCNISGSGNIEIFVTTTLNANISGSGVIRHKGTANVHSNISGSGKVINVQ